MFSVDGIEKTINFTRQKCHKGTTLAHEPLFVELKWQIEIFRKWAVNHSRSILKNNTNHQTECRDIQVRDRENHYAYGPYKCINRGK
jgi:hypothetical protein